MIIRELTAEDAKEYWSLRLEALKNNGEAFATTYEESLARENPIEQVQNNLASSQSVTFGAFMDGSLAGNVTVMFNRHAKMKHKAAILAMYVTPSFRKHGIGRKLLLEAEKAARKADVEILQLTVVTANTSAVKLYESAGFVSFGIEKHAMKYEEEYVDEMWMSKELK
ncbi:N-acetyltransferase family protein [Bacillus sp. SCS-153A]|uniref:GNAT family N-acetyltransferase n=1 Tax=Rossellomorea sedimentorum TaxID=3115294 RepID=UPI003905C4B9